MYIGFNKFSTQENSRLIVSKIKEVFLNIIHIKEQKSIIFINNLDIAKVDIVVRVLDNVFIRPHNFNILKKFFHKNKINL